MKRALNLKNTKAEGMNGVFRSINHENEALYAILNGLTEGVIVADKSGKFVFFNPVAEKILGIGSQDVPPNEWTAVYGCFYEDQVTPYPPEQLPLALTIHHHQFASDTIFIKNPAKPEGVFIFVSASPLFDPRGNFIGGMIVFRDISQIKQAENELKRSEEQARTQFKGFPIPTYVWQQQNDDFVLIDFNQAAEMFTFGKIKELLGVKLLDFYQYSPDLARIRTDFQQCFQVQKPIVREMSYLFQRSGIRKDLIVTYGFVPPNLILVHTQDITERKQAENELKKLWNVVQQTADSIILTNKQGIIEYVNPAFEITTGYTREEAIGRTPQILKSGRHQPEFYQNLWAEISSGKPFRGTIINKKKDSTFYWSEQTITPMKDENGNITNFVSVLKDITELYEKSPVFPLNPRDLVVFLTDGVIETVAVNKQQFGFERTLEVIQHFHPAGAQEIVEQLYLAVRNFSQSLPQEDDITSIVLKVLPATK